MSSGQSHTARPRVAVIGGGISGLAAAHRLLELLPTADVHVFEAGDRLGGVLQTVRRDGLLIERSADMFITKDPWALDLCRRLDFADQLIGTNPENRRAFIVRRGRLVQIPAGFTLMAPTRLWPLVTTPLLGPWGKLRAACEYFIPAKRDGGDESLATFATRRLGRPAFENIIQPLIGGIYTADPEKLSMAATMRQFIEMEQQHGGLLRAMRQQRKAAKSQAAPTSPPAGKSEASGARYDLFVTPREGMSSLIERLVGRLTAAGCTIGLNSPVDRLLRDERGGWRIAIAGRPPAAAFDGVIVAAPAPAAARLLRDLDADLCSGLSRIAYAGAAVLIAVYRREQLQHAVNGSGFVVPLRERRRILSCSFSSQKFTGRAAADEVLLRVFVGGACQPELAELSDDELRRLMQEELGELIGARGEPRLFEVVRWRGTMPQYHVGHLHLVEQLERSAAVWPRLELAGNAYRGVGIPFCIRSGEQAAQRLAEGIRSPT